MKLIYQGSPLILGDKYLFDGQEYKFIGYKYLGYIRVIFINTTTKLFHHTDYQNMILYQEYTKV